MTDTTTGFPTRAAADEQRESLRAAIRERGLQRFAFFGTSVKGRIYPNGMDETSGFVLNDDGRIWLFWTGWDARRQRVYIDDWEEEPITPLLTSGPEYERARRELGLD